MNVKGVFLCALAVLLAGCASPTVDIKNISTEQFAASVEVVDSEFSSAKAYKAAPITGKVASGHGYTAQLIAVRSKKDDSISHVLSTVWEYGGEDWILFKSATLPGAVPLYFSVNKRDVSDCRSYGFCDYMEDITVILPAESLISSPGGLRIQFGSSRGVAIMELPANYVQGYLQGVSSATGGKLM